MGLILRWISDLIFSSSAATDFPTLCTEIDVSFYIKLIRVRSFGSSSSKPKVIKWICLWVFLWKIAPLITNKNLWWGVIWGKVLDQQW
jgi:hypothetical protein